MSDVESTCCDCKAKPLYRALYGKGVVKLICESHMHERMMFAYNYGDCSIERIAEGSKDAP